MNSRTFVLTALLVALFVVGCGGGEEATATMRPTERLNGTWRIIGWPDEMRPVVFDFEKGTFEHPYLSGTGGSDTIDLTPIEETTEVVTFEARGYTFTASFNEDGTVTLRAAGGGTFDLERVE